MNYEEVRARLPEEDPPIRWLARVVSSGKWLLLLLFLVALVASFYPKAEAREALERKLAALQSERDTLQAERDRQARRFEWIKSDVSYLEIAARDRLGLQKDGEFVIRLVEEAPVPPAGK